MKKWEFFKLPSDSAYFELDSIKGELQAIETNGDIELSTDCCCGHTVTLWTTIDELKEIVKAWDERNALAFWAEIRDAAKDIIAKEKKDDES